MRRLHVRAGPVSATADLPEALARPLLGLKRRAQLLRRRATSAPLTGQLVLADSVPALHLERRRPDDALDFFRTTTQPRPSPDKVRGDDGAQRELTRPVQERFWYHTIELPGGVVTPGVFDHRPLVPHYGLPTSIQGERALDVATFDGFWAFELERRGADVVAIDLPTTSACDLPPPVRDALVGAGLDRPTGAAFEVAHRALGSRVRRVERSVYDLDPADLGTFGFVHAADLLVHLENPSAALRAIRGVTDGTALIVDCFNRNLAGTVTEYHGGWRGLTWWVPSLDTLAQMVLDAGFADVKVHVVYSLPFVDQLLGPWRAALVATT